MKSRNDETEADKLFVHVKLALQFTFLGCVISNRSDDRVLTGPCCLKNDYQIIAETIINEILFYV